MSAFAARGRCRRRNENFRKSLIDTRPARKTDEKQTLEEYHAGDRQPTLRCNEGR
jgi:hypothetical protein